MEKYLGMVIDDSHVHPFYREDEFSGEEVKVNKISYFKRLDEDHSMLRLIDFSKKGTIDMHEIRVITSKKDSVMEIYTGINIDTIRSADELEFHMLHQGYGISSFFKDGFYLLEGDNKELVKGTILGFMYNEDWNVPLGSESAMYALAAMDLRYEKFLKQGLEYTFGALLSGYIKRYRRSLSISSLDDLNMLYGTYDLDKGSMHQMLGLNKYQYKRVVDFIMTPVSYEKDGETIEYIDTYKTAVIQSIRVMLGDTLSVEGFYSNNALSVEEMNISAIDNKTFDKVFDSLVEVYDESPYWGRGLEFEADKLGFTYFFTIIKMVWGINEAMRSIDNIRLISGFERGQGYRTMYSDYIYMIYLESLQEDFSATFRDEEELTDKHDRISQIITESTIFRLRDKSIANALENERKSAAISSYSEFMRSKYHHETEDLMIVAPKQTYDLAYEGECLGHCVASYINRVSKQETSILFIRDKAQPDKPYFTLEIRDKEKRIVQCRTNSNDSYQTDDRVNKFVRDLAKKYDLSLSEYSYV